MSQYYYREEITASAELTEDEQQILQEWEKHPMRKPFVAKVVVNFAVGQSGPRLEQARSLCEKLTGQKPRSGLAKQTVRGFGIRKKEPIAAVVTLRKDKAIDFLKQVIWAKNDIIKRRSFDDFGTVAVGIPDHLQLPDQKFDPSIGSHGFDVTVVLERPGYRINRRRRRKAKIPRKHRVTREEAIAFFKSEFGVKIQD